MQQHKSEIYHQGSKWKQTSICEMIMQGVPTFSFAVHPTSSIFKLKQLKQQWQEASLRNRIIA